MIEPTQTLRRALRRDLAAVVDIWVDAFSRDPYLRWLAPDDTTWATLGPAWLGFIADQCFERGHTYLSRGGEVAVAWIPPDANFATAETFTAAYETVATIVGAERAGASIETVLQARAHSLTDSHWTLQYFGARSAHQGRGLGALAVAPILAECDADGLPCGLISTNPRNLTFYARHGFRVVAEVPTPDGAAVLRPMHRFPQA